MSITAVSDADASDHNIKAIFKDRIPFTNCKSKINNAQEDNAKDLDEVTPMYNLIEYSNNYSKILENL